MLTNKIFTYPLVFLLLLLFSRIYIVLAKKYNIVDIPNERSSHTTTITRGGGVLFILGLLLYFGISFFNYPYFIVSAFFLASISFMDDVKSLSVKQRLPIQFIAIFFTLFEINNTVSIPIVVIIALIFVGVVAINFFNFIDGINGMLGLYSLVVLILIHILNSVEKIIDETLIYTLIISLIIFGYYNFRKRALFFSGDVGSMVMGLTIFFLISYLIIALEAPVLILFVIVYLTDTGGTVIKRLLEKKNILKPHREHIYEQLANEVKIPHLKISLIYALLQFGLGMIALICYNKELSVQLIVVFIMIFIMGIVYLLLINFFKKYAE